MADKKTKIPVEDASHSGKDWGEISNRDVDEFESEIAMEPDQEVGAKGSSDASSTTEQPALSHPDYQALEQQLTEAEQRAQKNYDQLLLAKAEQENYKKRMERELAGAHKFAVEKLLVDLIPVLDSLDQGLSIQEFKSVENEVLHKVRDGMELTYKMLLDTLTKHGVKQINPEGESFNPAHHEAMSMQEDPDAKPNTVLKVFQKGYLLHDRLIRAARVIVAKG